MLRACYRGLRLQQLTWHTSSARGTFHPLAAQVGQKELFVHTKQGMQSIRPLCVLDFFVDPAVQRRGHGFDLFVAMLSREGQSPKRLASALRSRDLCA